MPGFLLPLAIAAGSGIAGALSNRKSARTGESVGTSTTTFNEPSGYSTLGDLLRGRAESRLREQFDMSGIESSGITGINDAFAGAGESLNNSLTARGLGTSPVAGAGLTRLETGRAGSIAEFLQSLPLLRRQMENEDFAQANDFYSRRPLGQTTTQTGTFTQPGSALGSGLGSAAEMLAFLKGQGIF